MPSPDAALTNAQARLTTDKGLGHLDYPAERILYTWDKKGMVTGVDCRQFQPLSNQVLQLDRPQTKAAFRFELERQYAVLSAGLISYKYTGTTCLLGAAASLHQLLLLLIPFNDGAKISSLAGSLLDIYDEIERRTRKPYQWKISFNDKDLYSPLPKSICQDFPLNQYGLWKQVRQKKWQRPAAAVKRKPFTEDGLITVLEQEQEAVEKQELENAIEVAENNIRINGELASIPKNDTPVISAYRANLSKLTLEDVYKQTKFRNRTGDWKLSELVEVIYYVSSMTLVLGKDGEPFGKNGYLGQFPYGMIMVSRKFKTYKFAPPMGMYVSLGPMAGQQFEINDGIIKKLSIQHNGILGYQEVYATGQWAPEFQQKANEVFGKNKVYMGSVVVLSAFGSKDVGLLDVAGALPDVVEYTIPYFLEAIRKKAKEWWDNADDLLKELAMEALKNVVVQTLKSIAVKYVVKKIGKKVIPVVNIVAGIKDAIDTATGDEDPGDAIAINCVRLHLKAINQDDKTLGSKILANIMIDKFENELKQSISQHASRKGLQLAAKVKGKVTKMKGSAVDHDKPTESPEIEQAPPPKPAEKGETTQEKPAPRHDGSTKKPGDLTAKEMEQGMKAMNDWEKKEKENSEAKAKLENKPSKEVKDKERAVDNKETQRPEDGRPGRDEKQTNTSADDKKKAKAKKDRLAKIKQAAEDKKKKPPPPPDQVADEVAADGRKKRRNSMARRSRKAAVKDALEDLRSGIKSERTHYLEEKIREIHGADAVDRFKRTGKLPPGFEYSHFFSVSEYPEFGDRGDVGVLTDKKDHRENHHKGNTRPPLHGYPRNADIQERDPDKDDDGDDDDDENDD